MHIQCAMFSMFDWEGRRLGMRERVKTRSENGLRIWIFSQNCRFLWGKNVSKTNLGTIVQYTIPIRHIANISDFVWFQRTCGSMKSVSFFNIIDVHISVYLMHN